MIIDDWMGEVVSDMVFSSFVVCSFRSIVVNESFVWHWFCGTAGWHDNDRRERHWVRITVLFFFFFFLVFSSSPFHLCTPRFQMILEKFFDKMDRQAHGQNIQPSLAPDWRNWWSLQVGDEGRNGDRIILMPDGSFFPSSPSMFCFSVFWCGCRVEYSTIYECWCDPCACVEYFWAILTGVEGWRRGGCFVMMSCLVLGGGWWRSRLVPVNWTPSPLRIESISFRTLKIEPALSGKDNGYW